MVPQAESPSGSCEVGERVLQHNEASEKSAVADLNSDSEEAGTWYYVVECAKCKALVPFKHAPEGEPILRFPTMQVRCFQCRTVHTYSADLVSRRKAVAPSEISGRDQLPDARDGGDEASPYQQEDRNVGDSGGREIVECKINPDSSPLRRDDIAVEAVSGKRVAIFFLSSCFFATGWVFSFYLTPFTRSHLPFIVDDVCMVRRCFQTAYFWAQYYLVSHFSSLGRVAFSLIDTAVNGTFFEKTFRCSPR
jgi:hypothetical protein